MRKLFFIISAVFALTLILASCGKQEVEPSIEEITSSIEEIASSEETTSVEESSEAESSAEPSEVSSKTAVSSKAASSSKAQSKAQSVAPQSLAPPPASSQTPTGRTDPRFNDRTLFDSVLRPYALSIGYKSGEYKGTSTNNGVVSQACEFYMPNGKYIRVLYGNHAEGAPGVIYYVRNADGSGIDFGAIGTGDIVSRTKEMLSSMLKDCA